MFAVCVTFKINQGKMDAFLPLMHQNARTSLNEEVGCHQFDVATDQSKPGQEAPIYEVSYCIFFGGLTRFLIKTGHRLVGYVGTKALVQCGSRSAGFQLISKKQSER